MAFTMGEWYLDGNQAIRVGIMPGIKDISHNVFYILGARIKEPSILLVQDKHLLLENPGVSSFTDGAYVHWITVRNPGNSGVTFNLAVQRYNL